MANRDKDSLTIIPNVLHLLDRAEKDHAANPFLSVWRIRTYLLQAKATSLRPIALPPERPLGMKPNSLSRENLTKAERPFESR